MKRVLLAFSGGVDSVSAALNLKDEGYDVTGVTFILSEEHHKVAETAGGRAEEAGIHHYVIDRRQLFREKIMDYFACEYRKGRTPNPCAMCNRLIKFPLLNEEFSKGNYDFFSTGHYIKIHNGRICTAGDKAKDQSYFLSTVRAGHLKHFVNNHNAILTKEQVRAYVHSRGVNIEPKEESNEICFIKGDYADFLRNEYKFSDKQGDFTDEAGKVIGRHSGYYNYTIGKRKGLKQGFSQRMYVKAINAEENIVILSPHDRMRFRGLRMDIIEQISEPSQKSTARMRYRQVPADIESISINGKQCDIIFKETHNSITPGQICAVYENDCIAMSGVITEYFGQ